MIVGAIICYNEARFIKDAIESLKNVCGRIIVVDGAYRGFPLVWDDPTSTDGTVEIAKSAGAEVIEGGLWENQETKRNAYIWACKEGDVILHLDADERLVCEKGIKINPSYIAYRIRVKDITSEMDWLRLFKWSKGLHYYGAHNALFQGKRLIDSNLCPILEGVHIEHLRHLRSKERKEQCQKYYLNQYEYERAFRLAHGIP